MVSVARTWVFPIIRIIIFAAIAAALIKIAFFADLGTAIDPAKPTGEIVEPQVAASIGTIQNDVTMQGTVAPDAAVPIKATLTGQVRKVIATPGQWLEAGSELLTLRAEIPKPDGTVGYETKTVVSPIAGTLSTFAALVGQAFAVGDDIGKVSPPTYHVSGTLDPEQQYRLLNQPTEAQVTITGGPAPFACTGLTISTGASGTPGEEGGSGTTVRCSVPGGVKVFAGLSAEMAISGGIAENVLMVPTTAVEGSAQSGNVYFVLPDGTTEIRPVTLGLNDGINVEIVEGLADGDLVLQFIPGAPAAPGEGFPGRPIEGDCKPLGDGGMVCGG